MPKSACLKCTQDVVLTDELYHKVRAVSEKTLKLKKVAQHIGVPLRTLYRMLDDGRFPVAPIPGTKPRIWNTADVDAWIEGNSKCKT